MILIVEDEVSTRILLVDQLEAYGESVVAKGLVEAMEIIDRVRKQEISLDLAVVDLQLPSAYGIDPDAGFYIVESLQGASENTPVIVMTNRSDRDGLERALTYKSIRYFFTKTWHSDLLKEAVESCLKGASEPLKLIGVVEGHDVN